VKVIEKNFKDIGTRLRKIREEKRFTQTEVAKAMKVAANQYGNVENGKVIPSLKTLVSAAEVLGVSIDEIIYGYSKRTDETAIKDTQMADRIKILNELSGEDRTIALQLLDLIVVKKKFKDMVKDIHILHK